MLFKFKKVMAVNYIFPSRGGLEGLDYTLISLFSFSPVRSGPYQNGLAIMPLDM